MQIAYWYTDRWAAAVGIWIFGQEFCQYILWTFVFVDDYQTKETLTNCSQTNQLFSSLTTCFVRLIPSTFAYYASHSTISKQSRKYLWYTFLFAVFWFGVTICKIFCYEYIAQGIQLCSIVWDDGHIYWPRAWKGSLIGVIMYNIPIPLSFVLFKPHWLILVSYLPTTILYIILLVFYPKTADSLWCWSGIFILLEQMFILPIVTRWVQLNRLHTDKGYLWNGTLRHLQKYALPTSARKIK